MWTNDTVIDVGITLALVALYLLCCIRILVVVTTLRRRLGQTELDDLLTERDKREPPLGRDRRSAYLVHYANDPK
jgi:cell division protein FtsL